jgi:hypothetical protein
LDTCCETWYPVPDSGKSRPNNYPSKVIGAMPFKYAQHARHFIVNLVLKKCRSIKDVVCFSGVARTTLWRWLKYGIADKPIHRLKPKQSRAELLIGAILSAKPHCTLSMMKRELELQQLSVCTRTIHRMLQTCHYSRKRAKRGIT